MLSYRKHLAQIGITPNTSVSYKSFYSKPQSLREAILSMSAPTSQDWSQVSDIFLDENWTDEVQGVAWDGQNWIFSCDANQVKPGHEDKSIYVFPGGVKLKDDNWISRVKYYQVPHPIAGLDEGDDHWGQLTYHKGLVYVSHFWKGGPKIGQTNVVVFENDGGSLRFLRWIELGKATSSDGRTGYPEFQAINPWDGKLYTCLGGDTIVREFFIHDPATGLWDGKKKLTLQGYLPHKVQGACFSPNGHLFVADDTCYDEWGKDYKWIFYYSALNGFMFGKIPVLAEEADQELEGVCYGGVSWPDGRTAQIHVVLLENRDIALDNIFFKSFASAKPDIV